MTHDEILERIQLQIAANGHSQEKPYTEESRLKDDIGMDSLDILELSVDLEKAFDLKELNFYEREPKTIKDVIIHVIYQQAAEAEL